MGTLDEETLLILPLYKRYEKHFEPLIPWFAKASIVLGLSIYGLGFFHQVSGIRLFFWEGIVAAWLLILAVVMFSLWIFIGVLPEKAKSMETKFRERCTMEKEYGRELKAFSLKSRQHFSNYIRHFWETEEARYKFEAAILLALGGILSTLPEWIGKPKVTFSFLVVALALAYARLLVNQKLLVQAKSFGELLEKEDT
jgi:hypothetical protein